MKIDPLKMLLYGIIVFIILIVLAYYSLKLTVKIYKDEFFEESISDSYTQPIENEIYL